jgi:hypothetical protein
VQVIARARRPGQGPGGKLAGSMREWQALLKYRSVKARVNGVQKHRWFAIPEGDEPKLGDLIVSTVAWSKSPKYRDTPIRNLVTDVNFGQIVELSEEPQTIGVRPYLQLIAIDPLKERDRANREAWETARV